ncbi:MAG: hypothetical protein V4632_08025 [Pseudomonadota bacterium]
MATIIAGRFQQQNEVQKAVSALVSAGFSREQISSFYVNPPGQHDQYALGGDHDKSPGAEDSGTGSSSGMAAGGVVGAAVGAMTAPLTGPLGVVTGAFVGAHIGSLVGTLGSLEEDGAASDENAVPVRHSGMMVAISVPDGNAEDQAIGLLRSLGASDIERTSGTIAGGDWTSFDPAAPPSLIDGNPTQQPAGR